MTAFIERVRRQTNEHNKAVAEHNRTIANVYYSDVLNQIDTASQQGKSILMWNRQIKQTVPPTLCCPWTRVATVRLPAQVCQVIADMLRKEGFSVTNSLYEEDIVIRW